MSGRFGLTAEDEEILLKILQIFKVKAKVFGSRAHGTEKMFSDLDLCIMDNPSLELIGQIHDAFDASQFPIVVDISRFEDLTTAFRNLVEKDGIDIP